MNKRIVYPILLAIAIVTVYVLSLYRNNTGSPEQKTSITDNLDSKYVNQEIYMSNDDSVSPSVTIAQIKCENEYTFYYKSNKLYRINNSTRDILIIPLLDKEEEIIPFSINFGALSADEKHLLIIVCTGNCGIGGILDAQELYKVNIYTLRSKCIIKANEITHSPQGFRVKSLILKKEGKFCADNEYREVYTYYNTDGEKLLE